MKQRGFGYILNVSSMAAKLPCPGISVYSATKAYLKSFSKSMYFEMLKAGVKIGLIGTPEWLVRRALRGLFRKRRVVKPGAMNYYLPPLIAILPNWLVARIWKRINAE